MDKNEVKKDLYKSKNMAKLSHYVSGNLYYNIVVFDELYQFAIPTVEEGTTYTVAISNNGVSNIDDVVTIKLSEDLGTTTFGDYMKGSDLNRWISKAIDKGEFVKIK